MVVKGSSSILKHHVDNMMDYALITKGAFEKNITEFDIRDALNSVVDIIRPMADLKGTTI